MPPARIASAGSLLGKRRHAPFEANRLLGGGGVATIQPQQLCIGVRPDLIARLQQRSLRVLMRRAAKRPALPVDMRRPGDTGRDSKWIASGYGQRWGISQRHRAAWLPLRLLSR